MRRLPGSYLLRHRDLGRSWGQLRLLGALERSNPAPLPRAELDRNRQKKQYGLNRRDYQDEANDQRINGRKRRLRFMGETHPETIDIRQSGCNFGYDIRQPDENFFFVIRHAQRDPWEKKDLELCPGGLPRNTGCT